MLLSVAFPKSLTLDGPSAERACEIRDRCEDERDRTNNRHPIPRLIRVQPEAGKCGQNGKNEEGKCYP